MISRVVSGRVLVNKFGFFSYLKERYKREKVFHLFDSLDVSQLDDNKKLEFSKKLILLRNQIDGKDKVGIQAIKSYLTYLCIQEKQLIVSKQIQSDDHIFYKNISDKCTDVDLVRQTTIMSQIFYYINGGDLKLLRLQLEFDLLVRKRHCSELQDKFEQIYLKLRLQDVLNKLVLYTNKHYSNSDNQLIQTIGRQYLYNLTNSQEYMKESKFQEALDELVVSQTQLNSIWSKVVNKDDFRAKYQRMIIDKLVITAKAKYFLKQEDGLQLFIDAINHYVDIGVDEQFYEIYTDVVKFLLNFDIKGCLLVMEKMPQQDLNLRRMELEKIKIIALLKLEQLKRYDMDKIIDLYSRLENQNEATDYEYFSLFCDISKYFEDYDQVHKYLELVLKKLILLSPLHQSNEIIQIAKQIQFKHLIQSQNALQIYDLIMQISEKSCFRLKDNFIQLQFEDQIKTLSTERIIITIQAEIDINSTLKKQKSDDCYSKTLTRLQYLEDLSRVNYQLRLPILEILKDLCIEEREIDQKIDNLRKKILNAEM